MGVTDPGRLRGLAVRRRPQPLEDFEALYYSMSQRLLVFFTRRTADPEIARDLWAETWARAYAGRERFRGDSQAEREGWVLGIGKKVLATYYKRGAVEQRAMARLELVRPDLADADLERLDRLAGLEELRGEVGRAMADLPGAQQEALRLRIVEGLSYEDVAQRMGVNEDAARARVSRGLRTLAKVLDRDAVDFELGDWV